VAYQALFEAKAKRELADRARHWPKSLPPSADSDRLERVTEEMERVDAATN
jgi:hypothetical protein